MARIRIAKATSGAAFLTKKRETEARLQAAAEAAENGLEGQSSAGDDIFELQHHHLLQCLERTTVSQKKRLLITILVSIFRIFSIISILFSIFQYLQYFLVF